VVVSGKLRRPCENPQDEEGEEAETAQDERGERAAVRRGLVRIRSLAGHQALFMHDQGQEDGRQ
jgi:hypothetical protein